MQLKSERGPGSRGGAARASIAQEAGPGQGHLGQRLRGGQSLGAETESEKTRHSGSEGSADQREGLYLVERKQGGSCGPGGQSHLAEVLLWPEEHKDIVEKTQIRELGEQDPGRGESGRQQVSDPRVPCGGTHSWGGSRRGRCGAGATHLELCSPKLGRSQRVTGSAESPAFEKQAGPCARTQSRCVDGLCCCRGFLCNY